MKNFTSELAAARGELAKLGMNPAALAGVMTFQQAIEKADERARQLNLSPALTADLEKAAEHVVEFGSALAQTQTKANELKFGPALEGMRTQMEQVAATWDGTQTGMLEAQRRIAAGTVESIRSTLGAQASGSKEYLAAEQADARLTVQIHQQESEQVVATLRARNSQIEADTSLSATQRLEAERESTLETLADASLSAQDRERLEQQVNQQTAELARQNAAEKQAIERSNVSTTIAISRMQLEAQKNVLGEELAAHQVNAAQKLAIMKQLTTQLANLEVQEVQAEMQHLAPGTQAYQDAANKIKEIWATLQEALAAIGRQGVADAKTEGEQDAQAWQKAVDRD